MSQCVPSWDLDDPPNPSPPRLPSSASAPRQLSIRSDCEVAELTWSNGHLFAHGLSKPTPKYPPSTAGTLESVVDQAKLLHPAAAAAAGSPTTNHLHVAVDALVPTHRRQREDPASGIGSCDVGDGGRKRARVREQPTATARSADSMRAVDETDDIGFATTNSVSGSPNTENTSIGGGGESRPMTVADDHDSVCPSQRSLSQRDIVGEEEEKANEGGAMRSTVSTKRSRAAAIHNQSERKRRDRINQKIRTLQKLLPNPSKTDKASMLDEVIDYLKQLQAQVQMMSRMSSMPAASMMMPAVSMQQFHMAMMAQMAQIAQMAQMGMGMPGMGMMDMATLGWPGPAGISPVMPASAATAFLPMIAAGSWDPSAGAHERMQQLPVGAVMPEPFSAFVPCPTQQPMTMDAYQRMAALYQQMFQQSQPTNPK